MTARHAQWAIAAVFALLGGWALAVPQMVINLTFLPEYREGAALPFAVGCFGAQALIAALFAATARFTPATFLAYGLSLFVFFAFDLWFTLVDPLLTPLGGVLDGVGNAIMLVFCWIGWRRAAPVEPA